MITTSNIPASYKPYGTLSFCSNTISGGGHIFAMGDVIPLLIGVGRVPRIWLQAVVDPGRKKFATVVVDSKPTHPAVDVTLNKNRVTITIRGETVLTAETTNEGRAEVSELDLRPVGLNVFGGSTGLNLGGLQLSNNTFANVGVAFGLGS